MAKQPILLGYFEDPHDLMVAGDKARRMGYDNLDAYMPYPIHGIDETLGLKKSWVPAMAKTMLVIGAIVGFAFQTWVHTTGWQIDIGGRPLIAWPAFIPITFESAVFFAGWTTIISVVIATRMKPAGHKFIDRGFTDDKLALVIPYEEERSEQIINFLKENGSYEIIKVDDY